jgi:hypothetical protein
MKVFRKMRIAKEIFAAALIAENVQNIEIYVCMVNVLAVLVASAIFCRLVY